ncbi:GIY-YIG nuclease family protein [Chryseobacterium sp. Ch-15]|uniref:GIY-YIG nuclease family protein n=1 Tax=Chryseobacterium muglaense TaxID=2893752 RepID=A0A9Q3YR56_9FLAO|nr:GIY-YIG nuclease family protein [Chryseobacterium muglaense]MBD3906184.1 GIY-YIG nuclease family protein [Chryseobacterium muglaense]MCC9033803.1 GIY-YIG nuclease family protein [Chryseobacterium muglaense]MCM2555919.1 GIY-YIG nuclease family protein [Chryseobacterium muglaense]
MIEFTEGIYTFYVYILTNKNKTVLYTGVTNNLHKRLHQHKAKTNPNSFTAKYNAEFLIYYEKFGWIQQAIEREKEIKNFTRIKKLELIRIQNPNMDFLNDLFQQKF